MKKTVSILALFLAVFCCTQGFAQMDKYYVEGDMKDGFEDMSNAFVIVYSGGKKIKRAEANASGKFSIDLEFGRDYILEFHKQHYASKKVQMFLKNVTPEMVDIGCKPKPMQVTMIQKVDGIDYSPLDDPVGKIFYDPDIQCFDWDADYSLRVMEQIAQLQDELEEKKSEYDHSSSAAEKALNKGDLESAKASIAAAEAIFPNDSKVKELKKKLEEEIQHAADEEAKAKAEAEEKAKKEQFDALVDEGDKALKEGNYDEATAKFQAAAAILPANTAVKTKLQVVEDTKSKKAAEEAAKKKAEEEAAAKAAAEAEAKKKAEEEAAAKKAAEEEAKKKAEEEAAAQKAAEEEAKKKAEEEAAAQKAAEEEAKKKAAEEEAAQKAAEEEAKLKAKEEEEAKKAAAATAAAQTKAEQEAAEKKAAEEAAAAKAAEKEAAQKEKEESAAQKEKEKELAAAAAAKEAADKEAAEKKAAEEAAAKKAAEEEAKQKEKAAKEKEAKAEKEKKEKKEKVTPPAGPAVAAAAGAAAVAKKEEPKKEEPKPEPKKEEPKPEPKKEEPKPEPKKEEPKPEPKKEEPKPAPKKEQPKPAPKTKPEPHAELHASAKKMKPKDKHADIHSKLDQAAMNQTNKVSSIQEHHEWDMKDPTVHGKIGVEYPEGVTEEVYMQGKKEVTERVVVQEGHGDIFWKVVHPWGGVYYFKNNVTISAVEFQLGTTLKDEDGNVIPPYHIDRVSDH